MRADPLTMSLETVIAASPMLGHMLEDRSSVRNRQEPVLVDLFREAGTVELSNPEQQHLFLVAPLDLLVVETEGRKQFHITETNGTGIGGLTNLPLDVVATVLDGLTEMATRLPEPNALVLAAISGMESNKNPRHNHLVHEKMLYAEALKRGFEKRGHPAKVLTMAQLEQDPKAIDTDQPTVVLGYIKELLNSLGMNRDGRLHLFGRPVDGAVNDRFCLNVLSRFGHQVDMTRFATMNRWYIIRLRLCAATLSEIVWRPASRASRSAARRSVSPRPLRRCSGTTAMDSSGVFSSTNPYPGSSVLKRRHQAAPTRSPSISPITPPSPSRPHPWW